MKATLINKFGQTVSLDDANELLIQVSTDGENTHENFTIRHEGGTLKINSFVVTTDSHANPGFHLGGDVEIGRGQFPLIVESLSGSAGSVAGISVGPAFVGSTIPDLINPVDSAMAQSIREQIESGGTTPFTE